MYDLHKIPDNYDLILKTFGHSPEEVPPLTLDPQLKAVLDTHGDVFELTSLHLLGRAGMAAVNEGLRSKLAKEGVKTIMNNNKIGQLFAKLLDKETQERYATTGEVQLSDEARFWIPLATTLLFMMAHSLGYIDFGENHWHGNDPVPFMLNGQFLAATSLVAWHYITKYPNKIKQLVLPIVDGVKYTNKQLSELTKLVGKMSKDVARVMENAGENIDHTMRNSYDAIEERVLASGNKFNQILDGTTSYIDMESRIARLMVHDYLDKFVNREEKN